ncbi:MAG: hypothetical protein JWO22_1009, partial [Frankiales bacterium]|nr:hypothetical protein [Frankiales bacterium]
MPEESGPLSAMAVDGNAWRHDASYLADPATPVLTKLRTYLARKGVRFTTSDNRMGPVLSRAATLATWQSGSLATTLTKVL